MAWVAPKTWSAVVVTVADLNQHIRDNLLILKTSIDNIGHITWLTRSTAVGSTLTTADDVVFVTATSTQNLPASPVTGKPYTIKSNSASATVTVSGNSKNIDGASTFILNPFDAATFIYNGTQYNIF